MKKWTFILTLGLLGLLSARFSVGPVSGAGTVHAEETGSLPASLDNLYPPKADGPVLLQAMVGMGTSFSGMVTDFMEGDFDNAQHGYADFRVQYGKLSLLVPEWAGKYPTQPMDELGAALESRDPAKFMPAVEHASGVCHACHVQTMTQVQQRFHWDDFQVITVSDPASKHDVPFRVFMQMLDGDLTGVHVDLAQGQIDQARQHALGLATRYEALRDACTACHDSERSYYVDPSTLAMIGKLREVLASDPVDRGSVQKLVQGVGMESCHKCHLVHGPAALARYTSETGR